MGSREFSSIKFQRMRVYDNPCRYNISLHGFLSLYKHLHITHTAAQPYSPDSNIEFLALLKLEGIANIPVLTAIENNAEKFVDTAGFKLVRSQKSREVRIACEYIEAWKMEKIPIYKPTWSGLFEVLGQVGLNSLATRIDSILKETSPSVVQQDEHEDPLHGN